MKAATQPTQRRDRRLLVVDTNGIAHRRRSDFTSLLRRGDLVIANDAATVPASLSGVHARTDAPIEVRLAGWSGDGDAASAISRTVDMPFTAVVFGEGDYRTPTEHRPLPPRVVVGDEVHFPARRPESTADLRARVVRVLQHPRLVQLQFDGAIERVWNGLAELGRPIQYAYVAEPLALWDTWTHMANQPVAFEPPSAGFILDWAMLRAMRRRGVRFATITHAAGISSTGDAELDRLLPLDEPYRIPGATAALIDLTRVEGGRVIAVGTTVVRALEAAADLDGRVRSGMGVACNRLGPATELRVVDAIVSGMHEPGTSHYELLKAFVDDEVLREVTEEAEARGYLAHEFGDAAFIVRQPDRYPMRTFRGNCELSSRNVFFRDNSSAVGCTVPFASVARDTIVCSPGVAPSHL
jgi:S-adenosylmethionine:tRNA ribosyltransferase-isomerase